MFFHGSFRGRPFGSLGSQRTRLSSSAPDEDSSSVPDGESPSVFDGESSSVPKGSERSRFAGLGLSWGALVMSLRDSFRGRPRGCLGLNGAVFWWEGEVNDMTRLKIRLWGKMATTFEKIQKSVYCV